MVDNKEQSQQKSTFTATQPTATQSTAVHLWVAIALAGFVLLLYYRLLFTNRVLASGDILYYFYPYRAYAAEAFQNWQIPLWNPYIFLGTPFLANPQAAVLYPFHWPLSWLPVTKQIYWSAAFHTWLLGFGGYLLLRRWGYSVWSGLVTGLLLAGSGFYGGLIGHINQMNGAAWLPWAVLILESSTLPKVRQRSNSQFTIHNSQFTIPAFALCVAMMLLAGHTQTTYINLFGLGIWLLGSLLPDNLQIFREAKIGKAAILAHLRTVMIPFLQRLIVFVSGTLLGTLISAAQLLPTLELSNLGLRSGGLSYGEASSFSLKPLQLHWTLFPSYGLRDLSVVFSTLGYTEFVAYIGLIGFVLVAIAFWKGSGKAFLFALVVAGAGLFLAAGRWNPIYFLLYKLVPGFDLFRAPARWMMLYTMGMAVLAGIGFEALFKSTQKITRLLQVALILIIGVELIFAARALPHTQPTAPQAVYDTRTAPAHLLTDPVRTTLGPAAMGRFLSMSTITFDPGDMADYHRIFRESDPPQLDQRAFDQLVVALKGQEILSPNLPMLWQVPAVDGFDGGVLPLQRYIQFLTLFIPPERLVPDGRLREQLSKIPNAQLLGLLNAQYIITDKVRDQWFEGVYYDRQIGATLSAEQMQQLTVDLPIAFEATHLGLLGYVKGDVEAMQQLQGENRSILRITPIRSTMESDGVNDVQPFTVQAGGQPNAQFADGLLNSPMAIANGTKVAYQDVEGGREEYLAMLTFEAPFSPESILIKWLNDSTENPVDVVIQAATLIDERTNTFMPLLPSDQGRFQMVHGGDVKLYENLDVRPRAYLVHDVVSVSEPEEALDYLHKNAEQLDETAVVEKLDAFSSTPSLADKAQLLSYQPERVVIQTNSTEPALLVLSDSYYPGWVATVDGDEAPVYPTNYLFRGVKVPAGEHEVIFHYEPQGWQRGLWLSLFGLFICFALPALKIIYPRK